MRFSETEFETLYKHCFPPSMRMAMSLLHDEDEARDIIQEVFVRIWESDILIDNPKAFIIRSVRNACINRLNTIGIREKIRRNLSLEPPPDDTDPEQRNEEVASAVRLLLTSREQEIVEKIYSEGKSYRETAEILGISQATINKHVVGALKKLRIHFKRSRK